MAINSASSDAIYSDKKVVVLVGGVGGAKLAYGLMCVLPPSALTVIVNVADDFWHYGLRICPDSDTILYTLSERVDKVNGWGVRGDSTVMLEALRALGEEGWFRLGDRDLATHLVRTNMLRAGKGMTEITQHLAAKMGVRCTVLPVTDAEIATHVTTREYGELEFQEYFVRHRWQPHVTGIRYAGIESAQITPEVASALQAADMIFVGPSNPWLSIEPVLAVPGMRETLLSRDVPRVAVTPIIDGRAVKGPAAKIMRELSYEVTAHTVARYYGAIINGFVFDETEADPYAETTGKRHDLRTTALHTMMYTDDDKHHLARSLLTWVESWSE